MGTSSNEDHATKVAAVFESELTLPSSEFQKLIRDMTNIGEFVEIKSVGNTLMFNLVLYNTVIALTGLVSWLSYNYIEKKFLSFKIKYTVVTSGENAKKE